MKIPITFLGTGQAIPTAKRNHTAIFLSYANENLLIDCGEGTQRQFRKAKLNPCKITRLLITHFHGDHILGIPGLLQTLALNGYNRRLYIYGPKGSEYFISKIMQMFIFEGKIDYEIKEINSGIVFETNDIIVKAEPMIHGANCLAYSFEEKDKIRIDKKKLQKMKIKGSIVAELVKGKDIVFNGKKVLAEDLTYIQKGKKVSFIFDTKLNDNCFKIAENSDLVISEAVYTKDDAELAESHEHLTAEQAGEIAKKSKSKLLILSHLSQRYDYKEKIVIADAKKIFPNVKIAEDLMQIEI